jgi:hypothetical protein
VSRRREIANVKDRKKNEKRCMHEECYIFEWTMFYCVKLVTGNCVFYFIFIFL